MLLENRQQYTQMMQGLVDTGLVPQTFVDTAINFARENLKRNDRIVWWLKWQRLAIILSRVQIRDLSNNPQLQKLNNKYKQAVEGNVFNEVNEFEQWIGSVPGLEHLKYVIDSIPRVSDIVWQNQTPTEMSKLITDMEQEYTKKYENAVNMSNYDVPWEKVIDYGDTAWVLLHKGACDKEAKAMGHCGNVPSVREGDRILSYRNIREGNIHQPHLTFILDKDGYLGEMKGRANEKPKPKYHKAIIDLLKLPMIKGITGGGYAPQLNFSLDDLPDETKEALLNDKPGLGTFEYKFERKILTKVDVEHLFQTFTEAGVGLPDKSYDFNYDDYSCTISKYHDTGDLAYFAAHHQLYDILKTIELADCLENPNKPYAPALDVNSVDDLMRYMDTEDSVTKKCANAIQYRRSLYADDVREIADVFISKYPKFVPVLRGILKDEISELDKYEVEDFGEVQAAAMNSKLFTNMALDSTNAAYRKEYAKVLYAAIEEFARENNIQIDENGEYRIVLSADEVLRMYFLITRDGSIFSAPRRVRESVEYSDGTHPEDLITPKDDLMDTTAIFLKGKLMALPEFQKYLTTNESLIRMKKLAGI
jgi:hypothetical protein